MLRGSTAANAPFAEVGATPDGHVFFRYRSASGDTASYAYAYASTPVWVKLTWSGNRVSAFYSTDGTNYTQIGTTRTIALSSSPRVGLSVLSNNTDLGTGSFRNVAVTSNPTLL
jgi:hypothetical protein